MKVYNGTTWLNAYASLSGALIASNNLSDLSSAPTARTNLGLGTAATQASTAFAAASHTHAIADVTGLQTALDGKAATSHTHTIANVTNLQTSLDAKLNLAGGTLTGVVTGAGTSLAMALNNTTNNGDFVVKATGTGDSNLAGVTFWNSAYAIKMGIRADGVFGLGGWSRNAWSWYSDQNGNMVAAGNVTAYSDERKKKNWRDLPTNFVDQLAWVKSGIYDRIDEDLTQVGVSAQSLQQILPEAVMLGEDGDFLTVAYGNAALAAAVALAKRCVELEARIAVLEEKLK